MYTHGNTHKSTYDNEEEEEHIQPWRHKYREKVEEAEKELRKQAEEQGDEAHQTSEQQQESPTNDDRGVLLSWYLAGHKDFKKMFDLMKQTEVFQDINKRFLAGQDNLIFESSANPALVPPFPSLGSAFARAPKGVHTIEGKTGRWVQVSQDHFIEGSHLTADPTFITKILTHESLHQVFRLAEDNEGIENYPNLRKHHIKQDSVQNIIKIFKNLNLEPPSFYEGDHELMAEAYVPTLVEGMQQFDELNKTEHSEDWYQAMAWWGSLERATDDYKKLPAATQARYKAITRNEYKYNKYLKSKALYTSKPTPAHRSKMEAAKKSIDQVLFNQTRKRDANEPIE
ncbi:MAG: hypothetical protein ACFB0B_17850 [Thermonemataceae bacterium]